MTSSKRRRIVSTLTAALTLAAFVVSGASALPAQAADATSTYVAITPSRIADTRSGAPIAANTTRDFQITGSVVPANATAVVLNVTATRSQGNGFLQVFPTGRATIGSSSTLNLDFAGQTIPNAAFAPLGDGGKVTVFTTFTTDVLVDVFGYFVPATSAAAGRLVPVNPTRILDTRNNIGYTPPVAPPVTPPGNPGDTKNCSDFATHAEAQAYFDTYFPFYGDVARLDADGNGIACESLPDQPISALLTGEQVVTLQVAGRGGVPTSGVSAVVLNVTVASPTAEGFVQVSPTPVSKGAFSNLNPEPGRTIANLVVVPLGTGGQVDLYTHLNTAGTLDLLADVVGYFTDATAPSTASGLFVPITPTRNVDTRLPAPQPEVPSGGTVNVNVAAVAPGASAIAGNLTSTGGGVNGYLQLAPTPVSPGASSSLNTSYDGQTIANAVVSPVAAGGNAQVYSFGSTHVLLDVTGWFTG
jgi:Excalibur calcium-binding domain